MGGTGRKSGWVKRLRVAAAVVTILAAIPGAAATIVLVSRFFWAEPPSPPPAPEQRPSSPERMRPGPGRCPPYHVYRAGKCRDVREETPMRIGARRLQAQAPIHKRKTGAQSL
jgi:hypothetical protein